MKMTLEQREFFARGLEAAARRCYRQASWLDGVADVAKRAGRESVESHRREEARVLREMARAIRKGGAK